MSQRQQRQGEPTFRPYLMNIPGRGIGWKDQDGVFKCVSRLGIKCVAPISEPSRNLVGYVFSATNYREEDPSPYPFFVPNLGIKVDIIL